MEDLNFLLEILKILKRFITEKSDSLFGEYTNVNSIAIANKITSNIVSENLCIRFSVESKLIEEDLKTKKLKMIPTSFDFLGYKIKTDIVVRIFNPIYGSLKKVNTTRTSINRPLVPGISIGGEAGYVGTLGLVVKQKGNNYPLLLSNWHVLIGVNGYNSNKTHQPSLYDNSNSINLIGKANNSFIGLDGDCATSSINSGISIDTKILDLGITPTNMILKTNIKKGLEVIKSGRTTGITEGIVSAINVVVQFKYDVNTYKKIETFEIKPKNNNTIISANGDSGSAWLINEKNQNEIVTAAGLHVGSSVDDKNINHAYACYIEAVFDKLNIELYP